MDVMVPKENNNDELVMISKLHVKSGEYINADQDLIEFETSKTAVVLTAPISGYVKHLFAEGDEVAVNSVVSVITLVEDANAETNLNAGESSDNPIFKEGVSNDVLTGENEPADNLAVNQQIYSEAALKLNLPSAQSMGKYWVTSKILLPKKPIDEFDRSTSLSEQPDLRVVDSTADDLEIRRTSMRKRTEIDALRSSGGGIFQSTIGIDIDVNDRVVPHALFNGTIQDLLCFEASKMLGDKFKDLNSYYVSDEEIVVFDDVTAGISLDSGGKLTVASIPNANDQSLSALQKHMSDIFINFDDGTLSKEQLAPSTFTISDLSSTGVAYVRPLLNGLECILVSLNGKAFTLRSPQI